MLGLFIVPALLALGLIFNLSDDDDDEPVDATNAPEPGTGPDVLDVPAGADIFTGTANAETINARDEGGTILAGGGNDTVNGSEENDRIDGQSGNDAIFAKGGDDTVTGGQGNDRIFLGDGDDISSTGANEVRATAGDDFIRGGAGNDLIIDALGSNTVFGDLGDDSISVVDGLSATGVLVAGSDFGTPDIASGGFGNDALIGDDGDTLTGGQGNDEFGILADLNRAQANVTITDFNPSEDSLVIGVIDPNPGTTTVTFNYDESRGGVLASTRGTEIAFLQGLTAADIGNIQLELITGPQ